MLPGCQKECKCIKSKVSPFYLGTKTSDSLLHDNCHSFDSQSRSSNFSLFSLPVTKLKHNRKCIYLYSIISINFPSSAQFAARCVHAYEYIASYLPHAATVQKQTLQSVWQILFKCTVFGLQNTFQYFIAVNTPFQALSQICGKWI